MSKAQTRSAKYNLFRHLHLRSDRPGRASQGRRVRQCAGHPHAQRGRNRVTDRSEQRHRIAKGDDCSGPQRLRDDHASRNQRDADRSTAPAAHHADRPVADPAGTIGNDLPALPGTPAKLGFVPLQGAQIPALGTLAGQAYRNRFGTVNQSIGDSDIAEYMVAGAHYSQSSTCCGTYGNMESSANPGTYAHGEVEGEMFALAFSNGNAAVFGYCDGNSSQAPNVKDPVCNALDINWPGVDAEAGVYLYGPQQPRRRSSSRCSPNTRR
jgi:hypothetical protein